MALVNRSFQLDNTPGAIPQVVKVSEYDQNRQYTVTLIDEGGVFEIPSGTTAKVEGTIGGSGFSEDATISGNTITFALSESMTAKAGDVWCKIKLTKDSKPIQTAAFILRCDRAGVEADTVIGADGFDEQITSAVDDWLENHDPIFTLPSNGEKGQLLASDGADGAVWLKSRVTMKLEAGSMRSDTGAYSWSYGYYWQYRRTPKMVKVGESPVEIRLVDSSDSTYVSSFSIYQYGESNGEIVFLRRNGQLQFTDGSYVFTPESDTKYIHVGLTLTTSIKEELSGLEFLSSSLLETVYNANIYETFTNPAFSYKVGNSDYTIGQLILPPNYKVNGKKVPLIVYLHGTGHMSTWTQQMGVNGDKDFRPYFNYLANEGFAIFDCYPWTDRYYSASARISPYNIETHRRAYIDGINYVCSRFNVDIDNVFIAAKSLGGQLGHWFMMQTELPVRAVALLATSSGYASTIWSNYFVERSGREAIVEYFGLGNETGASLFVSKDTGAMQDSTCVSFVEAHRDLFAPLNPSAINTHGTTEEEIYANMITGVTVLPQWMQDRSIPKWPSNWETGYGIGVPNTINHPEYSKYCPYPVKFWCAWDDINTSSHVNYTIYMWLKNSASDVEWRTLANGTGAHNAMDVSPLAEKSSGTTRLGISYSGIATAAVEMADYFYSKMKYFVKKLDDQSGGGGSASDDIPFANGVSF